MSRSRAQTVSVSKRSKRKDLNKVERHTLLLQTVKLLGYDMDVFHLRWMPGEYLDKEILQSVPIFWFKKFGWSPVDLHKLYNAGQIEMSSKTKKELTHVYGKRKRIKRKDSGTLNRVSSIAIEPSTKSVVNKDDIYRRTRRLLKKCKAVPTKVRLVDNRSEMNIQNASFPDYSYVSVAETMTEIANKALQDEEKDTDTDKENDVNLEEISETNEQIMSGTLSPQSSNKRPGHRSTGSVSTPFGEIDANATVDLRAKHRRTSSLFKREQLSMTQYGEIVWNKLAIQSGRGDTLSQRQFDIELQNNSILADPDICKSLFKLIQSEEPIDKKKINKDDMDRVCDELSKIPLVEITENIEDNEQKISIVLKQVFVHIAQNEPLDVSAFLTIKLSANDLNNVDLLLEYISSRHKEWTTRLQILKWITANLETSPDIRGLTSDANIGPFLLGWMCQCLDERSNIAKGALEMFPNILSIAMTQTGEAFQYLDDIFSSLFLVLRNKRSKDLNETANECCIQCVDMIMDWHEHGELDNEVLLEISAIFRDNTNKKEQKHDKVRERCCAYFGYIVFGIQGSDGNNNHVDEQKEPTSPISPLLIAPDAQIGHNASKSADYKDGEEKWEPSVRASIVGQQNALKISKTMKRIYLLNEEHQQFIEYMNDAMNNALNDKSGETRTTAFRLLEKLESVESDKNVLSDVFSIDALSMSKFKKWRERKNKSNKLRKKKSSKKKNTNKSRIKNSKHSKKNSVTLTIGAS